MAPRKVSQALKVAFLLNASFCLIEIVGGFYTGSVAILADAIHDFGDTLGLGVALWLEKKSLQGRDSEHSYGYARYSIFAQALSSVLILMGSVFIFRECVERLQNPVGAPLGEGMLYLAILGVFVNGFAALKLGRFFGKHSHHGHDHGGQPCDGHGHKNTEISGSEKLFSLHLLEDAMGWVFVLVGAIGIMKTGYLWIDPALGIVLSLFVAFNIFRHAGRIRDVLLQKTPKEFNHQKFRLEIGKIPRLVSFHDLHVWTLDGTKHILSMHVVVKAGSSPVEVSKVKSEIQSLLSQWGDFHLTLETELESEACRESCDEH
jgi:cobalt-zinc-cadmium efflux system protein